MESTWLTNPDPLTLTLDLHPNPHPNPSPHPHLSPFTFHPAQESTWLTQFESVMVFESHTESVSRVQQIWKYVPQRLYEVHHTAHITRRFTLHSAPSIV